MRACESESRSVWEEEESWSRKRVVLSGKKDECEKVVGFEDEKVGEH